MMFFCFVFSITPLFHHSIIPKNTEMTGITNPPPGDKSKPRPLGVDSLLSFQNTRQDKEYQILQAETHF